MTRDEWLALDDEQLLSRCELQAARGSGPGGQKRNKTSTAVRLRLNAGERRWEAADCTERSFFRNRAKALRKLRIAMALDWRESPATAPGRLECSSDHADYPLMMARVTDVLAECGWDYRVAALRLEVSPSALLKRIFRDPGWGIRVNRERAGRGLPPLRG